MPSVLGVRFADDSDLDSSGSDEPTATSSVPAHSSSTVHAFPPSHVSSLPFPIPRAPHFSQASPYGPAQARGQSGSNKSHNRDRRFMSRAEKNRVARLPENVIVIDDDEPQPEPQPPKSSSAPKCSSAPKLECSSRSDQPVPRPTGTGKTWTVTQAPMYTPLKPSSESLRKRPKSIFDTTFHPAKSVFDGGFHHWQPERRPAAPPSPASGVTSYRCDTPEFSSSCHDSDEEQDHNDVDHDPDDDSTRGTSLCPTAAADPTTVVNKFMEQGKLSTPRAPVTSNNQSSPLAQRSYITLLHARRDQKTRIENPDEPQVRQGEVQPVRTLYSVLKTLKKVSTLGSATAVLDAAASSEDSTGSWGESSASNIVQIKHPRSDYGNQSIGDAWERGVGQVTFSLKIRDWHVECAQFGLQLPRGCWVKSAIRAHIKAHKPVDIECCVLACSQSWNESQEPHIIHCICGVAIICLCPPHLPRSEKPKVNTEEFMGRGHLNWRHTLMPGDFAYVPRKQFVALFQAASTVTARVQVNVSPPPPAKEGWVGVTSTTIK